MTAKRKGKAQGDPGAAMLYMRRLHGDPDYAPAGDLADADYDAADLALGPEGEQTTDLLKNNRERSAMKKKNNGGRP